MEFMIKHPIITLLIVDEICTTVKSIVVHRYEESTVDTIGAGICDGIERVKEKVGQKEETKVVGFVKS